MAATVPPNMAGREGGGAGGGVELAADVDHVGLRVARGRRSAASCSCSASQSRATVSRARAARRLDGGVEGGACRTARRAAARALQARARRQHAAGAQRRGARDAALAARHLRVEAAPHRQVRRRAVCVRRAAARQQAAQRSSPGARPMVVTRLVTMSPRRSPCVGAVMELPSIEWIEARPLRSSEQRRISPSRRESAQRPSSGPGRYRSAIDILTQSWPCRRAIRQRAIPIDRAAKLAAAPEAPVVTPCAGTCAPPMDYDVARRRRRSGRPDAVAVCSPGTACAA